MIKRIVLTALLALPVAAWAFVKPVRVLAPPLAGLTCHGKVCVDDQSRLSEATGLYENAVRYVRDNIGEFQSEPLAVFCSTKACSKSFGFTSALAYNVATVGVVISNRGWRPYLIRHEFIHHLQNEHLGSLRTWLLKPDWFREGMAYSLSQNPRTPLPEPLQGYRSEFETWFRQVGNAQLWPEAEHL
jgi:hypothetical protein